MTWPRRGHSADTPTCWGYNSAGQASPPTGVYTAVSSGAGFACAIKSSGAPACWGDDTFGQTEPLPGTYSAITAGWDFGVGTASNNLIFWGDW